MENVYFDPKTFEKTETMCKFYGCYADHKNCGYGFCEKHHNEKTPHINPREILTPEEKRKKKAEYYKQYRLNNEAKFKEYNKRRRKHKKVIHKK